MFYVYLYLDPRKPGLYRYHDYEFGYEPIYVGKGQTKKKNGKDRMFAHLTEVRSNKNRSGNNLKFNKIKSIINNGNEPIILMYKEFEDEKSAFELESAMIKAIGRIDKKLGPLINLTDGGEGCSGAIISEQTRKIISEKVSKAVTGENNPFFGKQHSEKIKQILRKKNSGENHVFARYYILIHPDGTREKIKCLRKLCVERGFNRGVLKETIKTKIPISKGKNKGFMLERL